MTKSNLCMLSSRGTCLSRHIKPRKFNSIAPRFISLATSRPRFPSSSHTQRLRSMSGKDHSIWSDISKSKSEPDGSFKRRDSTFRNFIEKGGRFEPELGQSQTRLLNGFSHFLTCSPRSLPPLHLLRMPLELLLFRSKST